MSQLHYDSPYIILSFVVAIFTAYVALDLIRIISKSQGKSKLGWIFTGSISLAVGLWSSHFIGMMPLEVTGITIHYEVKTLLISLIAPLLTSGIAFYIASLPKVRVSSLLFGGVALGTSTIGIHYMGMHAIQGDIKIDWDITWLISSVVIR